MGKIDPSGKRFGVHGGLAIEQRRDAVRQRRIGDTHL